MQCDGEAQNSLLLTRYLCAKVGESGSWGRLFSSQPGGKLKRQRTSEVCSRAYPVALWSLLYGINNTCSDKCESLSHLEGKVCEICAQNTV